VYVGLDRACGPLQHLADLFIAEPNHMPEHDGVPLSGLQLGKAIAPLVNNDSMKCIILRRIGCATIVNGL
jgi:hypothetical protein